VNALGVVNSDLVRLDVDEAVCSFVDEACTAHATNINPRALNVLDIEALDAKREHHDAVADIFDDHVFLTLVFSCCLDDRASLIC